VYTALSRRYTSIGRAHQTVLDHGGELWADDESTQGARFFVKLPL
jgi:sensor histidine kinase regulating citrate/malate metabolism